MPAKPFPAKAKSATAGAPEGAKSAGNSMTGPGGKQAISDRFKGAHAANKGQRDATHNFGMGRGKK